MESTANLIKDEFESGYLRVSLQQRLLNCEQSDLAPLFKQRLPANQPVLEAGAGAGIWVAWFIQNGWKTVGLEWSKALCVQAAEKIPEAFFVPADMRAIPFGDFTFGSVVALGSIEHLPEGPLAMLGEFKRVLKPGGIAVITVPYNGPLRRFIRVIQTPVRELKSNPTIRRLTGRSPLRGTKRAEALKGTNRDWIVEFHYADDGWHFYEYQFTAPQMRALFLQAGLSVVEESVIMADSGIYNTMGRLGGSYDPESGRVALRATGKIIKKFLGTKAVGHMLCYVVRK